MQFLSAFCCFACVAASQLPARTASAHEFWLDPESYQTSARPLAVHLRVGQSMIGEDLPYLSRVIAKAFSWGPADGEPVTGREGDFPALTVDVDTPGLYRLSVETKPAYIEFADIPSFSEYLTYEGLATVIDMHMARGLPTVEIAEEYLRYARALVQVGAAVPGQVDAPTGMRYELVMTGNPYDSDLGQMKIQLLWEGSPQAGTQITVFYRPLGVDKSVEAVRELLTTDASGLAVVPRTAAGWYLLNAVHMEPVEGPGSVVWQSHWASLSFTVGRGAGRDQ